MTEIINLYLRTLELQKFPQDETELRKAYIRVIFEWHPDKHYDEEKKIIATRKAAQINAARDYLLEILKNYKDKGSNQDNINVGEYKNYQTRHTYKNQEYTVGFPEPDIFEIFLKSSFIVSTGYDKSTRILYIKMNGKMIYKYFNVPESIFNDFINADSPGRFAHKNIFPNYRYQRFA